MLVTPRSAGPPTTDSPRCSAEVVSPVPLGNIRRCVPSLLLLCAQGHGNRVVTKDPGGVSWIAQEAVFGGDPLHLADARHAGHLIERKSSRVVGQLDETSGQYGR